MIRNLTPNDEGALAIFFIEHNLPSVTRDFHPFPLDASAAKLICNKTGYDRYFAFFDCNSVLGLAMLRGWDEGYVVPSFGILVHRLHHGKGIGGALIAHTLVIAKELHAPRIRLTVNADNARAIRLYEKADFHITETLADGRLVMFAEIQ